MRVVKKWLKVVRAKAIIDTGAIFFVVNLLQRACFHSVTRKVLLVILKESAFIVRRLIMLKCKSF